MNSNVKVVVLLVVIVACLGFVVSRFVGGDKAKGGTDEGAGPADMYCLDCKKAYTATIDEAELTPLMMAGQNAEPKHTCPNCSKKAGVHAVKCAACGAMVPSPGMQVLMMPPGSGMKAPKCVACGKTLKVATPAPDGGGDIQP